MDTTKNVLPGYGLAVIDTNEDDGEDRFDTPQVGELLFCDPTESDAEKYDYSSLVGKTIYWKKYADQDATFFDKEMGKDVVFLKLEAIVGFDK